MLLAAFVWVGAQVVRGTRTDPTGGPGRVLKAAAQGVHHIVGVLAVAVLALLAITAVKYFLL